ncbi:MAG: RNA polymerase sigma factor [Verrucomicrobiales bacterium]
MPARKEPQSIPDQGGSGDEDPNKHHVELMLRVKKGDIPAFEELIEIHQMAVIGTIAKMMGNPSDAEDLAQQVFVRIWKSASRYEPRAKFTTWLFTITRNLVFNEMRRRYRKHEVSMEAAQEEYHILLPDKNNPRPDDAALHEELQRAIDAAIDKLPEKQRLAVILRRYENLPYEEISVVLDLSVSAVKSLLFRARTDLREHLKAYLEEDA